MIDYSLFLGHHYSLFIILLAHFSLFIIKKGHYSLIIIPHLDPRSWRRNVYTTLFKGHLPVGIIMTFQQVHDVERPSYQRRCDVMTSHRR